MKTIELNAQEANQISSLLTYLASTCRPTADENLDEVALSAHELPLRLRRFLLDFKQSEPTAGACVISGYAIDPTALGRTPSHWRASNAKPQSVARHELHLLMLASLLGDAFGWYAQQDGRLVHDILPIKEHEEEQISSGGVGGLAWHTEDAFHSCRADYVGLMCLRNPERTTTTIAHLDHGLLTLEQMRILSQPRFIFCPDTSFVNPNRGGDVSGRTPSVDVRGAVLFGDMASPYLRADPCFMSVVEDDVEAKNALQALIAALNENMRDLCLSPGDCCFIDNFRVVHGRRAFSPRYDGNDRWLKRVNVTRDLRKSRACRSEARSHVVFERI